MKYVHWDKDAHVFSLKGKHFCSTLGKLLCICNYFGLQSISKTADSIQ